MALRTVLIGDTPVLVEVEEQLNHAEAGEGGRMRSSDSSGASRLEAEAVKLDRVVQAVAAQVKSGLSQAAPDEWQIELGLGFEAAAGVPYLVGGKANGSIKVTVKWKKGSI